MQLQKCVSLNRIVIVLQIASLEAELVTFHEREAHFEKRAAAVKEREEHLSSMQQEIDVLKETIHQVLYQLMVECVIVYYVMINAQSMQE